MNSNLVSSASERVPVATSAAALEQIINALEAQVVALFFAHRGSKSAWNQSITRVTLSLVDSRFAYIPVETTPSQLFEIMRSRRARRAFVV